MRRQGLALVVLRTVPAPAAAIALLATLPAAVTAGLGKHDFAVALTAASLLAGSGVGYAADDPAAPTLESSPTTLAVRRSLRAVVVVAPLGACWLVALLVATRYGDRTPDAALLAAELCATAALSACVASRAPTHTPVSTGFGSATAALLTMVSISALAYQWHALPALGSSGQHDRWWLIVALGTVAAAWSSRDPAARLLRQRARPVSH